MNCHLCQTKLTATPSENYNNSFQLNCISKSCPMRKFVERCRLSYNPKISKMFFIILFFGFLKKNIGTK